MKHLIGLPIAMTVCETGIQYTIIRKDYIVEIFNTGPENYDVLIADGQTGAVVIDCISFDTLIVALQNADEMIGELVEDDTKHWQNIKTLNSKFWTAVTEIHPIKGHMAVDRAFGSNYMEHDGTFGEAMRMLQDAGDQLREAGRL